MSLVPSSAVDSISKAREPDALAVVTVAASSQSTKKKKMIVLDEDTFLTVSSS